MDKDVLDFLDGPPADGAQPAGSTDQPKPDAVVETTEKPAAGAMPAAGQEGSETAETDPPATTVMEDKSVPLATFLDMRDKLKKAEGRVKELEPAAEEVVVPDPVKDPRGYADYQSSVAQVQILNERLNVSERFARKEHGAELIDKVKAWALEKFETDEDFTKRIMNDADPYEAGVKEYQREQLLKELEDPAEIEAFRAWKASQQNGGQPPAPKPQPDKPQPAANAAPAKPAAPATQAKKVPAVVPKSINDAPGGGGGHVAQVQGDGVAFDSLFKS